MRYKRPDHKNALSIIEAAEREMNYTLTIKVSEMSASTIIRNTYECFRMLGDAMLVLEGIESEDHLAPIRRLTEISINSSRPLNILDNLRRLRHNINYYGYKPSVFEAEEAIFISKSLFEPLCSHIKSKINTNLK